MHTEWGEIQTLISISMVLHCYLLDLNHCILTGVHEVLCGRSKLKLINELAVASAIQK